MLGLNTGNYLMFTIPNGDLQFNKKNTYYAGTVSKEGQIPPKLLYSIKNGYTEYSPANAPILNCKRHVPVVLDPSGKIKSGEFNLPASLSL